MATKKTTTSPNSTVPFDPKKVVTIDYTNYKGERAFRRIVPLRFGWFKTEYHTTEQWMLAALDVARGVERTFAVKDIHSWEST